MAISKVVMPKLSEQMETGKIIKWLKQEGDRVQAGDILAEVETDKADVEMEAFGSGVLRKILVQAGSTVPVGGLIGVVAEPNDDIAALVSGAGGGATAAPAAKAAAGATEMASRPAAVPPQPRREDPAARTPAPSGGPAGAGTGGTDTAPRTGGPGGPGMAPRTGVPGGPEMAPRTPPPARPAEPSAPARVKASPLARKVAAQSGVDLRLIQGSGPGGRAVRKDVEAAAAAGA